MISSDIIRGHIDTLILKLLQEKDMYGYQLSNEIKERTMSKFDIKEATLYSVVQRLEVKKMISSYNGEKTHGGKRRYYRITPFGKAYYHAMIQEWQLLREIMSAVLGSDIHE